MIIENGKGDGSIFYKKFGLDFPDETFRGLKEKEEREYGEYRTRHLKIDGGDIFEIFRYSSTGSGVRP